MKSINKTLGAAILALLPGGCDSNTEYDNATGVAAVRDETYAKIYYSVSYIFAKKSAPTLSDEERYKQASMANDAGEALWESRWERLKSDIEIADVDRDTFANTIVELRAIVAMKTSIDAHQMRLVEGIDTNEVQEVAQAVILKCGDFSRLEEEGVQADAFSAQAAALRRELGGVMPISVERDQYPQTPADDRMAGK